MLIKRRKHTVPSLNTTSTADISFMLLIFFLVTSSMDVDRGLVRQLPPPDKTQEDDTEATDVSRDNTMSFKIGADSRVTLDGKPVDVSKLRGRVARFIGERLGSHVIYVDADPAAHYDAYFALENEIVAAYNQVRDGVALKRYHRKFEACSERQKDAVRRMCPQRIAETYATTPQTNEKGGGQ